MNGLAFSVDLEVREWSEAIASEYGVNAEEFSRVRKLTRFMVACGGRFFSTTALRRMLAIVWSADVYTLLAPRAAPVHGRFAESAGCRSRKF